MKTVHVSLFLHGNMCYDRYTKQEIRAAFPKIYVYGVRAMARHPEVTAHIDMPGLTVLSLAHHADWFLDELRPLVAREQAIMVGCQYAASHALCADEESDLMAARVGIDIMRDQFGVEVTTFFNQESPFHPQDPYIMGRIGARRLIMGSDWGRPRWVRGIDGSRLILCPLSRLRGARTLTDVFEMYDDGDFVMMGGDFELLGNLDQMVREIEALAADGKRVEWTTIDRYEREHGMASEIAAPTPFRAWIEDAPESPSMSRWVSNPEDAIWHGEAVRAMDAIRTAGFAATCAQLCGLDAVDVPIKVAWTTEPDNGWDGYFEHVDEYPETEVRYLTRHGQPTLLSRAWHHLLIGLNSDASGWKPWQPRTRHREIVLQASRALSREVTERFARRVAARIETAADDEGAYVLAINPMAWRYATVTVDTEGPMALAEADGTPLFTETLLRDGRWSATARVALPAHGYKLLRLTPTETVAMRRWREGDEVANGALRAALEDGRLNITSDAVSQAPIELSVPPFSLTDPSGVAETEAVAPDWANAVTRVRDTAFGPDLEVMTELTWAVWLRLVIGLREDHIALTAEVHVDRPRLVGPIRRDAEGQVLPFGAPNPDLDAPRFPWSYAPDGLRLALRGCAGEAFYDIPYATIRHPNEAASFVAAQRFGAIKSDMLSFGVIALGGNQSFELGAAEGLVAVGLGASTQGRPDTRPECVIRADGTAEHRITTVGDPLFGSQTHCLALVFGAPDEVALAARRLRTAVPVVRVTSGMSGSWPTEGSLIEIAPENAHATAFRCLGEACEVVVNDLSGESSEVAWRVPSRDIEGRQALGAYGVAEIVMR